MTCKNNHFSIIKYQDYKSHGFFCKECHIESTQLVFNKNNYDLINFSDKFQHTIKCKKCGTKMKRFLSQLKNNPLCYTCNPYRPSGEELLLYEKLKLNNLSPKLNYWGTLKSTELDIFLEEYNLVIEINGLAFHSTPNVYGENINKYKHFKKYQECSEKGIQLLQFTDIDIRNKLNIVVSIILSKCNKNSRIFGRKCIVKTVNNKTANLFYNNNHLQGKVESKHNIGLYHQDKLVACMSFSGIKTNKEGIHFTELTRYASKTNINVVGGFSKLLKNFIKQQNKEVLKITSFSDNMYSDGGVYERNGFGFINELDVDYKYTKLNGSKKRELLYKSRFMKKYIKKNMIWEDNKTEKELMEMNGYSRYYDAKKKKWVNHFYLRTL